MGGHRVQFLRGLCRDKFVCMGESERERDVIMEGRLDGGMSKGKEREREMETGIEKDRARARSLSFSVETDTMSK